MIEYYANIICTRRCWWMYLLFKLLPPQFPSYENTSVREDLISKEFIHDIDNVWIMFKTIMIIMRKKKKTFKHWHIFYEGNNLRGVVVYVPNSFKHIYWIQTILKFLYDIALKCLELLSVCRCWCCCVIIFISLLMDVDRDF